MQTVQKPFHTFFHEHKFDILILGIGFCILFMTLMGHRPLNIPDEGRFSEISRLMVVNSDWLTPRMNGIKFLDKPIFFHWFQASSIKAFGLSEWALRLPAALMAVLGCLITYLTTRKLFDRKTALIASTILATSPLYFGTAVYINVDMTTAVFLSSTLLLFLTALEYDEKTKPRRWLLYAAYLSAALATLTKGLIGIAIPGLVIGIWIAASWNWRLLTKVHLFSGLLIVLAFNLPWYILIQLENPEFFEHFFLYHHFYRYLGTGFNNPMPIWFYIPLFFGTFFPWSAFIIQAMAFNLYKGAMSYKTLTKMSYLFLWVTLIIGFFSFAQSKIPSYILPVYPAASILVAYYLKEHFTTIRHGIKIGYTILPIVALALLLSVLVVRLPDFLTTTGHFSKLYMIFSTLLVGTLVSRIIYGRGKSALAFKTLIASMVIFLFVLLFQVPHFVHESTKPFATYLKPILNDDDEVVTFFDYFDDLPVYLERKITVVEDWNIETAKSDNFRKYFIIGKKGENTDSWLITLEDIKNRWQSEKRLYLILSQKDLRRFKIEVNLPYAIIAKNQHYLLLTNQKQLVGNSPVILS